MKSAGKDITQIKQNTTNVMSLQCGFYPRTVSIVSARMRSYTSTPTLFDWRNL